MDPKTEALNQALRKESQDEVRSASGFSPVLSQVRNSPILHELVPVPLGLSALAATGFAAFAAQLAHALQ
jgi:hypothetical protein